ncbi:heparan-alpha-glucosaminide N-acetyltransferase-like isoform X1 [Pollicipes pollicipes]|uniref:heparan-alpha-glucosaminide N-acetyltransferase-like isoform X1 n=2 Tax=Pollicipes pollicipes TaxID=41117 RepID=UPI001884FFCD|nr:heparan-alpha-glucosaminide N-acetyltransferase-like isoform X1 [Pollicipes pollicipes]
MMLSSSIFSTEFTNQVNTSSGYCTARRPFAGGRGAPQRWPPSRCAAMAVPYAVPSDPPRVLGLRLERPFECPGLRARQLGLDQACLALNNSGTYPVTLWAQAEECHGCDAWPYVTVAPSKVGYQVVNTTYPTLLYLQSDTGSSACRLQYHFGEFGLYELTTGQESPESCSMRVLTEPANIYAPLLFATLTLIGLTLLIKGINKMNEHHLFHRFIRFVGASSLLRRDLGDPEQSTTMLPEDAESSPAAEKLKTRIHSLDVFRGICIVVMIFVNYKGGHYWFFRHARWNGLTVADLVFPWFMWIMGASMVMSLRGQIRRSVPKSQIWVRMFRRCCLLFLFGLVINSDSSEARWDGNKLRLPGVLQRFALCSVIISSIQLPVLRADDAQMPRRFPWLRDIIDCWPQWLCVSALAAVHTFITFLLEVPGCPRGYLGAGGMEQGGQFASCTGGAAGYVDRKVLGVLMYHHPTCRLIYNTSLPYDPEGILGVLTSCVAVFFGCVAGRIIVSYRTWRERLLRFTVWALLLGLLAGGLCGFSKNDGVIPVNKNLWSLSFVLALSSMAFVMLTLLYLVVDVWRLWLGRPFYYAGLNSITLYLGHELGTNLFPVSLVAVAPTPNTHLGQLFLSLWGTLIWVFVAWRMYRTKTFIAL